ncbi:alginate O-acetyltransferase AlgF [Pseudomonas oryzihabitans]|nr:cell division protein FtsQ [Pseudomonas psychrotolerans]NMZ64118.1 cell division protein FtsQ [Pseudomonas oryzihabitans]QEU06323.1 cell division protein FtsQ [Pseudomonas oryzihabitans]
MKALLLLAGLGATALAQAAEIPLYPTGPSEDSAFLRFVNAGSQPLALQASGSAARLQLEAAKPVSDYLTVPATKAIKGELVQGAAKAPLELTVAAGEFATLVVLPGTPLVQRLVREQPDDFNALKASLAFYSLDPQCATPGLQAAGRNAEIFKDVADGTLQRRSLNAVALKVQLTCAGQATGAALDLGELKAGERYSVLLLPGASGPRLLATQDAIAH